jgi:hypothetical protein
MYEKTRESLLGPLRFDRRASRPSSELGSLIQAKIIGHEPACIIAKQSQQKACDYQQDAQADIYEAG